MNSGFLAVLLAAVSVMPAYAGPSVAELEARVNDTPQNAELHYKLAEACYESSIRDQNTYDKKLINQAMAEYKKAMDIDQNFAARCLGKIGIIQNELGFFSEARDKLERALKLDPGMKDERVVLAKIYNNEGVQALERFDYATGLRKLKIALELNPKLKDAEENLATSYYQLGLADIKGGQFETGVEKVQIAMEHKTYRKIGEQNLRSAYYNWGVSLSQLGYLDKAMEKFETALIYGKGDDICKSLAVIYCKKAASIQGKDMAGAIDWYKKGIKICPGKNDQLVTAAENNIKALKQRMSRK